MSMNLAPLPCLRERMRFAPLAPPRAAPARLARAAPCTRGARQREEENKKRVHERHERHEIRGEGSALLVFFRVLSCLSWTLFFCSIIIIIVVILLRRGAEERRPHRGRHRRARPPHRLPDHL